MIKFNKKEILGFLKKYGYIFVLSVLLLTTAIIIAVFATKNENPTTPVDTPPISFYSPVLNATILKNYSDNKLQWNTTLKHFEVHKAIALSSTDENVFAAYDGKVKSINTDYLNGTVIVIEHNNTLQTVYKSLHEEVDVTVGQVVKKGDIIGKISNTENKELNLGNHLTFEVLENNAKVNPANYLVLENK